MRNAALLVLVLACLAAEAALLAAWPGFTGLSGLFLLFLVLERSVVQGAVLAFCMGYLQDLLLGTSRGFFGAVYVLSFFLLRLPASRVSGGGPLFVTAGALFAVGVSSAVAYMVEHLVGPGNSQFGHLLRALPAQLLFTFVFAYPVFALCSRLDARFVSREDDFAFRG